MTLRRAQGPDRREQSPQSREQRAWTVAAAVADPEVPVLTIEDLGVLRAVRTQRTDAGERVVVDITPTYSGCPAMDAIRDDVVLALTADGFADVEVRLVLSPAWTTDWMSEDGKRKLTAYGIAPPTGRAAHAPGPRRAAPRAAPAARPGSAPAAGR